MSEPSTEELIVEARKVRERLRHSLRTMTAARAAARLELAATYESVRKARE
jgi:hypothetical protein